MTPPARRPSPAVPVLVPALAAAVGLLLAGCAGGSATEEAAGTGQDDVATLETDPPAADGVDEAPQDPLVARYGEPVRLRLDMSEAEEEAAWAVFDACVEGESGVSAQDRARAGGDGEPAPADGGSEALTRAHEACLVVAPLPPWEYDVQNPDAVAFAQAVVDCLRTKGVQHAEVVQDAGEVSVALGGPENDARSIALGMEHHDACEQEVVAQRGDAS